MPDDATPAATAAAGPSVVPTGTPNGRSSPSVSSGPVRKEGAFDGAPATTGRFPDTGIVP